MYLTLELAHVLTLALGTCNVTRLSCKLYMRVTRVLANHSQVIRKSLVLACKLAAEHHCS